MKPWREALHRDPVWSRRLLGPAFWMILAALGLVLLVALLLPGVRRLQVAPALVVYTSQDQVYAEPLLQRFSRETGIPVRPVFDSEAVKTVGLANRLLAERRQPQADVFWSNEELRMRQLHQEGVLDPGRPWVAFGYRSRRLVINTNLLSPADAPRTFEALTNRVWRGRLALAFPLFGTTATHFLALRAAWGEAPWAAWIEGLAANEPLLAEGNSLVVQLVGRGEAAVGMTDIDDIRAGQRAGLPVLALPLSADALLIPNTAGIIARAPHPQSALAFVRWLQRPEVLAELQAAGALEGESIHLVPERTLAPNWPVMLRDLPATTRRLQQVFLH